MTTTTTTMPEEEEGVGGGGDDKLFYGEITPCYIVLPLTTIAEMHKCFPSIKLIFIARDLVDRAWSAMIMELRNQTMGLNAGEFAYEGGEGGAVSGAVSKKIKVRRSDNHTSSVAQLRRIQEQSSPMAQSDTYFLERLCSSTHTSRSDYATHLRNWFTYFPAENILLLNYQDFVTHPREVLLKVVMHIGLSESDARAFVDAFSEVDVWERINVADVSLKQRNDSITTTSDDTSIPKETLDEATTSQRTLSLRPNLKQKMQKYLLPYAKNFNALLIEQGYTWKLKEI